MGEHAGSVRARIGLIIPSSNRLTEPQFRQFAPVGVEPHVTRLRITGPQHAPLPELLPRIAEAASALADASCDIIVFHCTASAMEDGLEAEQQVVQTIQAATGRRATTTASALMAALRALAVRRLALITPYVQATNDHEVAFLSQAGFEVLWDRALDLGGSDNMVAEPPSYWLRVAQERPDPRVDAYFLSCTNVHSVEVIEELEAALERPVITSNQATLWYCLRACGLDDEVPGLGKLLRLGAPGVGSSNTAMVASAR